MNTKYKLFYELALNLAKISFIKDEVPVGAVIIKDETYELISWSYNQMRTNRSSLDHAEMIALKDAMKRLQNERLTGCSMITTLEPCPMCAQAISYARLNNIIFSAEDTKSGGILNGPKIFESSSCHHKPDVIRVDDDEKSEKLLQKFFQLKRKKSLN